MATGRTVQKYTRVYAAGYDLSGFGRSIGPMGITHEEVNATTWTDAVKGYFRNRTRVSLGTLNAVFDNTATTGIHAVLGTSGVVRTVIAAIGIQAAPAAGDPVFMGQFLQGGYQATNDGGLVTVTIPFNEWAGDATSLVYPGGWGYLVHASGAETGANAANGFDNYTAGATTNGGYMAYQVLAGNGTATLSIDDSANNSTWAALSGATTGSINCAIVGSGVIALTNTATVRRYLRWQLALGTATTVTFVTSFYRA